MARNTDKTELLDSPIELRAPNPVKPARTPKGSIQGSTGSTAVEIAQLLGTSDTNLRTKWYPKLVEAFYWLDESDFKQGDRFTAFAVQKFAELQQAISPKIPKRSATGEVVRDATGRPRMVANPDRIGFAAYRDRVEDWKIPAEDAEDAGALAVVDAADAAELVPVDILDAQETALAELDALGDSLASSFAAFDQVGAALGSAIAARVASQVSKSAAEGIAAGMAAAAGSLQGAASAAVSPEGKKRRR